MPIKADFTLKLRPMKDIRKDTLVPIATQMVKSAQEVVGNAARNHPYKDRTGNNTKRLGFAVSAPGSASFGSLETRGAGNTDTRGAASPKKDSIAVIVASSSGYGGYLEIGTRKMGPFPYIRPAWEKEKPKLLRNLKGIV